MGADLLRIVLLGALLPGLIVGVGLLMLWGLLRAEGRGSPLARLRRLRWGAPLFLFLGYLSVQGATGEVGPELWSSNVSDRFVALGALALACALVDSVCPWRGVGLLAPAIGGGAGAWMVVVVLHPHLLSTGDVAVWAALGGLGGAGAVWLHERSPTPLGVVEAAQGVLVVAGLMGLLYWSGQAPSVPELGGIKGMLVAAGLASALVGGATLARGGWTFVSVTLVGYLALTRTLGDVTPPAAGVALVLSGVATGALGRWLAGTTRGRVLGGALALALAGAPIAVGSFIAWRAYDTIGDAPEDDEDGVYYTDDDDEGVYSTDG